MNRKTSAIAALPLLLCSACASINSTAYTDRRAPDGILYKLPEKTYLATVSYRLESCAPVKLSVADLQLATALAPSDDPRDWYMIDPDALNSLLSSIDPATIELNQGMLTKVGLKSKGNVTEVVKLAARVAAFVDAPAAGDVPTCTKVATSALEALEKLNAQAEALQVKINALELVATNGITEDQARILERLDTQLTAVKTRRAKHLEESLTKKVTVAYTPPACARGPCTHTDKLEPRAADFANWLGSQHVEKWLDAKAAITFAVGAVTRPDIEAATPSRMGYNGVYYRRPGTADVSASYANEGVITTHTLARERIAQVGALARVGVQGTVLGSRSVNLEFDSDGDMKKYEMTSTGVLTDVDSAAGTIATAVEEEPEKTELQEITEEVDLLKKKKERIEVKAALDALENPQ